MNFFEQQDRARQKTSLLVMLFALAVTCLVAASCALVAVFVAAGSVQTVGPDGQAPGLFAALRNTPGDLYLAVGGSIALLVALASLFRLVQLGGGGESVAHALGGRQININTRDPDEKRLLNVVEEMAIASGVAVPSIFLLEEAGINAFAAGTRPDNAVIGVTRGAIEQLNREELQGVVAHEFSHIFNGDMRLNLRLIALLYGILVIGIVGEHILRAGSRGAFRSRDNSGGLALVALGIGLAAIGYAGTFFGNLIKAAVSRQREFLADASAVQFTRSTDGIAGALEKIGGLQAGSQLEHAGASEVSHLFFAQGIAFYWNRLFATHPPLVERIQRLDSTRITALQQTAPSTAEAGMAAPADNWRQLQQASAGQLAMAISSFDGEPSAEQRSYSHTTLAQLPDELQRAVHEPFAARALVYALLLDANPDNRSGQQAMLTSQAEPVVAAMVDHLQVLVQGREALALTLVDLAIPALRQLSESQRRGFLLCLQKLADAGGADDLFRWSLYIVVHGQVSTARRNARPGFVIRQLRLLGRQLQLVCSALAYAGVGHTTSIYEPLDASQQAVVHQSFDEAMQALGLQRAGLLPVEAIQVEKLEQALNQLRYLQPLKKPQLLKALALAASADGQLQALEIQMVRAVAQYLDCPAPLMLEPDNN